MPALLPPNLRVAMDARMLRDGGAGVSSYARTLQQAIAAIAPRTWLVEADPPGGAPVTTALHAAWPGLRRLEATADARLRAPGLFARAHIRFGLYRRLLRLRAPGPPGLMHWTYPVPIMIEGWHNVYTIHDAIPLLRPDLTSIDPRRHRATLAAIAKVADAIVTVSGSAAADLAASGALPNARIVNLGQPVDVRRPADAAHPWGLEPRGFLFFCGQIEPRKNLGRLLRAFAASAVDMPLVVAGAAPPGGGELVDLMSRTRSVRYLGYQPRDTLLALLAAARALLFPSLAEGFGLPVAEAMTLGTPVLTSDRGALREVAGDAAMLVDPEDETALAVAIRRLALDDALCAALGTMGLQRAPRFAAASYHDRLARFYAEVVARHLVLT